jgi:hypothetical protein
MQSLSEYTKLCVVNDMLRSFDLGNENYNESQQHPSRICFITPGWYLTRDLNLLSLTMGADSNVSSNKCVTIMALKPNQLQVTTYNSQANAIIERVHKVVNDMLRSFDLENENNHENLELPEDNPFDYFLQSTAWLLSY